ncbi:MAG TPA: metal-sensing transcriptional repressor [Acidiferrobacterales bacterium]|nr:metal-sensing transcriptional repressor [Acidiferrobacterales bacterium]
MTTVSAKDREAVTLRLKRIEGQLRGIQKMIEQEAECDQLMQQMSAARKGLDRAFYQMMACIIEHELVGDLGRNSRSRERLAHLTGLLAKFA